MFDKNILQNTMMKKQAHGLIPHTLNMVALHDGIKGIIGRSYTSQEFYINSSMISSSLLPLY